MTISDLPLWALLLPLLLALAALFLLWSLLKRQKQFNAEWATALTQALQVEQVSQKQGMELALRTSTQELRQEVVQNARDSRQELMQGLALFQQSLTQQSGEATRTQNNQIDALAQQLTLLQKSLADTLATQLQGLSDANARRLSEVRTTLEQQLMQLQQLNASKLDEMRQTVDEKLQATLQTRLSESFRQVAERLELVHKGLGEMQVLAAGVGDLKHLLANVKNRGTFGEAQLAQLLEDVFTPDQYAAQVAVRPDAQVLVDFAVRLPGQRSDGVPLWLPIDAKFPTEDYERLLEAQQQADAQLVQVAARALELKVRTEAKSMAGKYIAPPHTTDFAILFLPSEGLYAEVLRRPGLMESLQREYRVVIAGPTTLLAMLSSLQMGFRTLALEQRSSEVWQVLGAVKTEFGKFGDVLTRLRSQTQTVLKTLDAAQTRSNVMQRALKKVDSLPGSEVAQLLPDLGDLAAPGTAAESGSAGGAPKAGGADLFEDRA